MKLHAPLALTLLVASSATVAPACGGADETDQKATLDACGLPAPCPEAATTSFRPEVESLRCIFAELAKPEPSVEIVETFAADGGPTCVGGRHGYVGPSREVVVWTGDEGGEGCGGDAQIERCKLREPAFYEACKAEADALPPNDIEAQLSEPCYEFYIDCAGAEAAACP